MKMWRKWIVFFTVCQNTLCIEQPYQLVDVNTRCFEIKVESRLNCNNESLFYHCLLDENYTKEYEVCREWKWISEGKCAYFNPYGRGNVDERNCAGNSTKKCATEVYRSDLNMQYDACYVKKRIAITIPIVPVTVRSTGSGTSDVQSTTETAPAESAPPESQFNSSAMGIALGVLVPLILLVVVPGILLFRKRRHSQDTSQREPAVERGEGDALMNTDTKCLAENEQNQQLIEKDKRTSTDDNET
ncbi:uncharacterized protein LOC125664562 isoform X6 [Ostrea edulis]|uniref:uncharacterized protein LOC125664562 isoform X6 n=1 Tax=Ostrea edulis TaxID=37623 RepID=UPI0024AFA66A|nr:uncharacterized protein LOC125664562 isoform X6 [Ostrea edulis]